MDTIKISKGNTRIIAHRGLSGLETENTNAAFVAAGNRSYIGIETDIHPNPEGYFVVMHDNDTKRVLGESHNIEKESLSLLRDIVLPDIDGSKIRHDLHIPILEEYISICKRYNKLSVLEIKGDFSAENLDKTVALVKSLGWLEKTIFISFGYRNLTELRNKYPSLSLELLVDKWDNNLPELLSSKHMGLDINYRALTAERIKMCHNKGVIVNCWTVNNPADGEKLAAWGVDFITSNILE